MQSGLSSAVVIELAAYRRLDAPNDEPPPSSQGARHPPPLEFTDLDAVGRGAIARSLAYAS